MRVPEIGPITKVEALASIAYLTLAARGNHYDPTLHDVACAVTQAAPLLHLNADPEGVGTEIEAMRRVCERHNWQTGNVVVLPRPAR